MASPFSFKKEWELSMERQRKRLGKKSKRIQSLSYDKFKASLTEASDKHKRAPTTSVLRKLQPVFDQLHNFVNAITSIVQSSPELTGFIWGSIQAVLAVASRFTNLLSLIAEMFHDLTSLITQLNRYLALFPKSDELQQCSRYLIDDYVGFSISAFLFFRKWPLSSEKLFEVPFLRNPHFSERDAEVELVRKSLTQPKSPTGTRSMVCLLQGLGGVGKTTIALEYAFRYRGEYDFVFWIPAQTELDVLNTAMIVSRKLRIGARYLEIQQQPRLGAEIFRSWLETLDKPWLLILDNIEELATVMAIWPKAGQGHILLTSQNSNLTQLCSSNILVPPLDSVAGSRLFLEYRTVAQSSLFQPNPSQKSSTRNDDQEMAELIATELSGIPIAITAIAGLLSSMSLDEILNTLRRYSSFSKILPSDKSPNLVQYDSPFGATWDKAQDKLDPSSLLLVQTLAMLRPSGLREEIILSGEQNDNLSIFGLDSMPQYHSTVTDMRSHHLVQRQDSDEGAYLLLHRLLQRHILTRLEKKPEKLLDVFKGAYRLISNMFPKQSPLQTRQNELWNRREIYTPHIQNLCVVFNNNRSSLLPVGIDFAELLGDSTSYFWEKGFYNEGYETSDAAEAVCDTLGDEFASEKANIYAISGAIRQGHGISQRRRCIETWNKALELRQLHLQAKIPYMTTDEDIVCWGNAWNDLGCIFVDLGCHAEAFDYFTLAWEIRKASPLCQQHYNHFPESPMNVAIALAGMGKHQEAIDLMSATTENTNRAFTDHNCAVVQAAHFALASILASAGRYNDAFSEAREVYERRNNIFGSFSRQTSDAAYMLAIIEEKRGNVEKARSMLELRLQNPNGWTEEAEARAKFRLGLILKRLGRETDASVKIKEAEKTLADLETQYGTGQMKSDSRTAEVAFDMLVSMTAGNKAS
ncbi:Tetratricopeptide-like helical [Fusarium austroafricanum]|uniref:Tetratricopeptide-like helical n=1 Tax=Fusarium austroafricanum TaxID=2364996 RepID=A0A8H4KMC8_9HYPO|nr:Tetratricopeptide-like helical [Fusarium austroafricanum]